MFEDVRKFDQNEIKINGLLNEEDTSDTGFLAANLFCLPEELLNLSQFLKED